MPFISRDQIDPAVKARYEGRYKSQLKEALLNPGLTAQQRIYLREQIRAIGQPKTYQSESPSKPGAVSFQA